MTNLPEIKQARVKSSSRMLLLKLFLFLLVNLLVYCDFKMRVKKCLTLLNFFSSVSENLINCYMSKLLQTLIFSN